MRCRLAFIGLLALVPVAATIGWWLMPEPRIGAAAFERIRVGMPIDELENMLGDPDDGELSGYSLEDFQLTGFKVWGGEGGNWIIVRFRGGVVENKEFYHRTLWERMNDWRRGVEYSPLGISKRMKAAA